jgi:hypothetical protein
MTQFEFVFILVSIVAGLALTRLLNGLVRTFSQSRSAIDFAHTVVAISWTFGVVLVWWGMWRFEDHTDWSFDDYFIVVLYIAGYFAIAAILYPDRAEVPTFADVRLRFCAVLVVLVLWEILYLTIADAWLDPWWYPYFTFASTGYAASCAIVRSVVYDRVFAIVWLVIWVGFAATSRLTIA